MSREKQIEEMAKILQFDDCLDVGINDCRKFNDCNICKATRLYNVGYRKQEWISVDERLPERWVMVLVCCDDIISTDFIASTGRWYEHIDHNSVTHWMPLPQPPKMKGGAE